MMSPFRILAIASLPCVVLSGPALRAQQPDSGPAPGVARISLVRGEVAVQRGESGDSIQARANLPLVEGDYVSTGSASRAEVQLDYSNLLRLDRNSSVRLASLEDRSFLVQIERGTATYSELRGGDADVDIETPLASVRPQKQGRYRIEVAGIDEVVVTVRKGRAEVASAGGSEQLGKGRSLVVRGDGQEVTFQRARAHPEDAWDQWNERRDRQLTQSNVYAYVNRSIYGAEDLEGHGRWVYVPRYGRCWFPSVRAGWAPYRHGRWVWMDYYGWSWVADEPWGWAPYHYGRWFRHARHGWGWHPGSYGSRHPWRPALVAFFGYSSPRGGVGVGFGHYGWIPLAPDEPYHPWYGRRYGYGAGRAGSRNIVLVDNSINVYNDYRNARHRNGVTLVDAGDFSRGRMRNARSLQASELRQASVMRGRVPVVPDRSSQGRLIGGTGRSVRAASKPVRYFSTGRSRRNVKRNTFSRQQQDMTEFLRSAGGTDGRAGGGAKVRSSIKGKARGPAATASPRGKPDIRPRVKSSGRRSSRPPSASTARPGRRSAGRNPGSKAAGGRTGIRSSGKSVGGRGQRGKGFDRPQSSRRTLTGTTRSRVSTPSTTRPRPGPSRSARPSRSPSSKSAPRVDRGRGRSASPRPTVSAPRSSPGRSSGIKTSPSRTPRAPARTSAPSRSRKTAPAKRSSPSRGSAVSSGRNTKGKSSTRSRQSSKSDDRKSKKRTTGKR